MCKVRICPSCMESKDHGSFYPNRRTSDGCDVYCKDCLKKKYKENRDSIVIERKKYRERNKEKIAIAKKEYAEKNKEKIREKKRLYYLENKDAIAKKAAIKHMKNPQNAIDRVSRWRSENPEKARVISQNRLSRLKSSDGRLSQGIVKNLLSLQMNRCPCCRAKLNNYHVDHIVPLSKGGKNEDSNIQLLCSKCNLRKHAKHPVEFMQELGFLI